MWYQCRDCKKYKPLYEMVYKNAYKLGITNLCKKCKSKQHTIYYRTKRIVNRKAWEKIIRELYGKLKCEICGKELIFTSIACDGELKDVISWDHRHGDEEFKKSPSSFFLSRAPSPKNIELWKSNDFGMLCTMCNGLLGRPNGRIKRLEYIEKHILDLKNYVKKSRIKERNHV